MPERSAGMGFSIGYDFGMLGWLLIAVLVAAAVAVLFFVLSASTVARREIVDEERDEGRDPPIA